MSPERLTTRILHPHDPSPSTEDIFSSALETLFTDDTQQSHGVPGQSVIYRSPRYGDVYLQIPVHPDQDVDRRLFAHYLWNAGVVAAEGIERASGDGHENGGEEVHENGDGAVQRMRWDRRFWDMRGMDVLEIGAATALPSLISALSNAHTVVSTDHPSSPAITANAIASNIQINLTNRGVARAPSQNGSAEPEYVNDKIPVLNHPPVHTDTQTTVCGYTWGTEQFYDARGYGELAKTQPLTKSFDRIIIADCLWMPDQHGNIVRTVLSYLKEGQQESKDTMDARVPCAIVVAGFHTGREIVNNFIRIATAGGSANDTADMDTQAELEAIEICEVDIDGNRRPWQAVRPTETKEQSKRWCMCAVLVRK